MIIDKHKFMLVGGGLLSVLGIGVVVYLVVWALGSKVYKALSPILGFLKSLILSILAHPVLWLAAIGAVLLVVVGSPVVAKVADYIKAKRSLKKVLDEKSKEAIAEGKPDPVPEAAKAAADVVTNVAAAAEVVQVAKAAEFDMTLLSVEEHNKLKAQVEAVDSFRKAIDGIKESDFDSKGDYNAFRDGLIDEWQVKMGELESFSSQMVLKYTGK